MRTTLRQLRYLEAIAQEGHFGRAAERVSVSQPAISAQIRELEAALGVVLVERSAAGARLTRVGAEVAARARRIVADVGDLEAYARMQGRSMAGPLRMGVIPSVAPYLLPRLLPRVAGAFPDLDLVVRETVTATLVAELAEGTLDVVIGSIPLGHAGLTERPLFDDAFLLATPSEGIYAMEAVAGTGEIPAEALLLLEDGHCLRDQALSVCGGIDPRRLRSSGVTSLSTILQLVAAGQGVTLLPEMFLDGMALPKGSIRISRFGADEPRRTVGLAWRRSNPMAPEFDRLAAVVAECGREIRGAVADAGSAARSPATA